MCNRVRYFKPIQLPIKWSSLSSSKYTLLSDHAFWRPLLTYAYSLTRLSVLNENKINTIRGIDTASCVEKLPAEQGVVVLKNYRMNTIHFLSDFNGNDICSYAYIINCCSPSSTIISF